MQLLPTGATLTFLSFLPQHFVYFTIDYYRIIIVGSTAGVQNVMLIKTYSTQTFEIKQAKSMTKQTNKPKTCR
jgi:hypothetical protein